MSGRIWVFFIVFCLFFFTEGQVCYAQNQRIADSLEILYQSGQYQDELSILKDIAENQSAPDNVLFYSEKLIEKASVDSVGDYLVSGFLQKGNGYKLKGAYPEAVEAYFKSIELAQRFGQEERIGAIYISIGDTYSYLEDYETAVSYYDKGIQALRESKDNFRLGIALLNSGEMYFKKNNLEKALAQSTEAKEIFSKLEFEIGIGYSIGNLGMVYFEQGKIELARELLNNAIEILTPTGDNYALSVYNLFLAKTDQLENKVDEAFSHAWTSYKLADDHNLNKELAEANLVLYRLHEINGNIDSALLYHLNYDKIQESITNKNQLLKTAFKTREFEVSQKQNQVDLLFQKNRNQRILVISTASAFILIGILAGVLYRSNSFIRRSNLIIEEERNKSDHLLRNILPDETVSELKEHGKVKAQRFDSVSVMFTDFKNFTKHASHLSPEDLVMSLDYYFSYFDQIVEKYKLEKIKTLGDSYMCSSGLPFPQKDHAERIVLAAMEMVEFVEESQKLKDAHLIRFEMRTGISSGPVIAGVVGSKKFAYDIWGDTVNCASRMENNSEPGKINISEDTHRLIEDKFNFSDRGEIEVKNKGKMKMYFVEGVK